MTDAAVEPRRELGTLLRSVVKVMTVSDAPDYEQPWQRCGPENSNGSGCIIETERGLRVLTNAHCVEDHVFVEVRRYGNARKYVAEVEAIGHECDLALLTVDDEGFFAGIQPFSLGELPSLSDRVSVLGYPIGGERLSITQGIVSRIDLVRYAQSQRKLLAVQIDAAINSGNSGGPVVLDDRLVGVAFQTLDEAEKVGYMIAAPVVEHFLKDVDDGVYDGFPGLGCVVQTLESAAHRRYLQLPDPMDGGVLVLRVAYGSSAWGVLREGDVLLSVDGVPIMADGTVILDSGETVDFEYIVARRHVGETATVRVYRGGIELECMVPMRAPVYLVEEDRYDVDPSYFVFGGLLFAPLTRNYLKTWDEPWWTHAPRDLMDVYERGIPTPELVQPVVLQKVLADRSNQGYHDTESLLVVAVDGTPVRSLSHLVEMIEAGRRRFVELTGNDGTRIVIDRQVAREREPVIMRRFGLPRDRSRDLGPPMHEDDLEDGVDEPEEPEPFGDEDDDFEERETDPPPRAVV